MGLSGAKEPAHVESQVEGKAIQVESNAARIAHLQAQHAGWLKAQPCIKTVLLRKIISGRRWLAGISGRRSSGRRSAIVVSIVFWTSVAVARPATALAGTAVAVARNRRFKAIEDLLFAEGNDLVCRAAYVNMAGKIQVRSLLKVSDIADGDKVTDDQFGIGNGVADAGGHKGR